MKKEDVLKTESFGYSLFSPKCCKEHKNATTKRCHIETSEWIFENDSIDLQNQNFDPWDRKLPSTQSKLKCMEELDQKLEQGKRQSLIDEIKEIATAENDELPNEFVVETPYSESLSKISDEDTENLTSLKESVKDVNPYLVLLNRLDEEEGVRTPSIEDKLKLAEDRLRISTTKFCKACEEIIDEKQEDSDIIKDFPFLTPGKVQEAFRPKVYDASLRPPQTLFVSEVNKKSIVGIPETSEQKKESRKEIKKKEMFKHGYYLPRDTWFRSEKEASKLTPEELDILNSTSTKAFIKFLEDRKRSPPKVLQEIQKKLESMKEFETSK